jgi:diguanylate cyclase (GGDEF)-like protein
MMDHELDHRNLQDASPVEVLRAVLDASCDGILGLRAVRDGSGAVRDAVVLTANGRAAAFIGHRLERLIDGHILELMPSLEPSGAWTRCVGVIERRVTERFEMQCDLDGMDTWFQATAVPLGDGFMLSLSDVTALKYALFDMEVTKEEAERAREELASEIVARKMMEGELRRIALTDGLTGVLNRRGFDDVVRSVTAGARRYGHALSVVAVDIDHFKRVNDLHGHAAGDTVLMTIAALIADELRRDTDSISRVGGEEFMLLLPHTPAAGAAILAERLRRRVLETPITVGDTVIHVTASFGVRELPTHGDSERMLIEADDALYRAKQQGRNRVVVWSALDDVAAEASRLTSAEAA